MFQRHSECEPRDSKHAADSRARWRSYCAGTHRIDAPQTGEHARAGGCSNQLRRSDHRLHALHYVLRRAGFAVRPKKTGPARSAIADEEQPDAVAALVAKVVEASYIRNLVNYCVDPLRYHRRTTREVKVGNVGIGGDNPIRVQSMITCDTKDTEASIQQTIELADAHCEILRITAPTVKDARNLEHIVNGLRQRGCKVPIVADIHFKPEAAMEAAKWVDKVRINPGNYADSKKFVIREYTDEQYAAELARIRERFSPLVELCKKRGIAMRIGTNHGSLSDRIMNRYGDTPLGMVESALEFARIARDLDYHDFVFSMKASNPKIMIAAYRLLVARLTEEGADWNYPIHLGVTEAGEGEDARIKSAIGIGSLLADGIGDTIRVSLTEDSVHEIPVAKALIDSVAAGVSPSNLQRSEVSGQRSEISFDPFSYQRRTTKKLEREGVPVGGDELVRVVIRKEQHEKIAHKIDKMGDYKPEIVFENADVKELDPRDDEAIARVNDSAKTELVTVMDGVDLPMIAGFRLLAAKLLSRHPILLKDVLRHPERSEAKSRDPADDTLRPSRRDPSTSLGMTDFLHTLLIASTNIGSLL